MSRFRPCRDPGIVGCAQVAGACISTSDLDGNDAGGKAGNITITAGNFPTVPPVGIFTMEPGSALLANSTTQSAGEIIVSAGLSMDIDGLVRSYGGATGTAPQPRGGGPITLKSGCQLEITPAGVVSSEGRNPGADLVHLEGCEVVVNGLVQSIVTPRINGGHALPTNPPNRCNNDTATHGTANKFTACVEIWANNITIDSILPNKGEVDADGVTDNTTNDTRAWIDLFAKNNITINNDDVGPFSVHAKAGPTEGDFGGLITIKAARGQVRGHGAGQHPELRGTGRFDGAESAGRRRHHRGRRERELNAGVVLAQGGATATNRTGGSISGHSFNGVLSGQLPGLLNANAAAPVIGVITLQGCGNAAPGDGVNYTGTTLPPATILADACGGNPTLPPAVLAELVVLAPICTSPVCVQEGPCVKRGMKFEDLGVKGVKDPSDPGLGGWKIRAYSQPGNVFVAEVTTNPDGTYEFPNLTCGLLFTFCEVLQPTWTQTFPAAAGGEVVSCAGIDPSVVLGPLGYQETLVATAPSEDNDFGNVQEQGECPKFPGLQVNKTITIDPNNATQIQDAINALPAGQTLLIMPHLGKKTENITIDKSIKVVGCSITLQADHVSAPVVTIQAGAINGSTTDVHATGSTVAGYKIEGTKHLVKNVRSFNNAIGFWITATGNGNQVVGAQGTTGNGIGFKIDGDGNLVDSATDVSGSTSHGAQLTSTATGNTIKKSTFTGNSGEGILVEGSGNIVSENKLYSNVRNGIRVTAANTQLIKNLAGDKGKGNGLDGILVSGNSGPLTENTARANGKNGIEVTGTGHNLSKNTAGGDAQQANTGCEFVIGASNQNGGSNKANGQSFSFGAGGAACVNP